MSDFESGAFNRALPTLQQKQVYLKRGCEQNFDPEVEPATKKQIPFGNENKKGKSKDQVSSFPPATKGESWMGHPAVAGTLETTLACFKEG